MSIYISERRCFGAGIVTLKFSLLNRRLEAEQSKALLPQDLSRRRGTPEQHLNPCDTHIPHLETQKLCVLTRRGAVAQTQLVFSTRTVITFIMFPCLCFCWFCFFIYQPRSCKKNGASVSKRQQFTFYKFNLQRCIEDYVSPSSHTHCLSLDVSLTRPNLIT